MLNRDQLLHKIFGKNLSLDFFNFIKNLNITFIGVFIASFFGFILNIFLARILGVDNFGQVNLILGISAIFSVFINFGLTGTILKKIKLNSSEEYKTNLFIYGLVFILINFLLFGIVLYIFKGLFIEILNVDYYGLLISLFLGLFLTIKLFLQASLQSLQHFKGLSKALIYESIFLIFSSVIIIYFVNNSYISYLLTLTISYFFFSVYSLYNLKIQFNLIEKTLKYIKLFYSFSFIVFLGGLFGILILNIDKILINYYLESYQLGLYSAYYILSLFLLSKIFGVIGQVIIPSFNNLKYSEEIYNKIIKSIKIGIIPLFIFSFILIQFGELLYGGEYEISFLIKILFSLNALMYIFNNFIYSTIVGIFNDGYKKLMISNIIGFVLNLFLSILFIEEYGIKSVIFFTFLSFFILNIYGLIILKNELKKNIINSSNT